MTARLGGRRHCLWCKQPLPPERQPGRTSHGGTGVTTETYSTCRRACTLALVGLPADFDAGFLLGGNLRADNPEWHEPTIRALLEKVLRAGAARKELST